MNVEKIFELTGHHAAIYCIEKGIGKNTIFSGSGDKISTAWDLEKQQNIPFTIQNKAAVLAIKYVEKYNYLLIGLFNGNLHVIDTLNKKEIKFIPYHKEALFHINYDEVHDRFFLLSGDGTVSVWSNDFKLIKSIAVAKDKIRSMEIQQNKGIAVLACGDGFVRIMNLFTLEIVHEFLAHDKVNIARFHPTKNVLLTGGKDAMLKVWNTDVNYQHVLTIPAHNWALYGILFSPNGKYMITSSRDKTMKIWNAQTLELIERIDYRSHKGHTHSVNCLHWPEGENFFISGGDDKKIIGWRIE